MATTATAADPGAEPPRPDKRRRRRLLLLMVLILLGVAGVSAAITLTVLGRSAKDPGGGTFAAAGPVVLTPGGGPGTAVVSLQTGAAGDMVTGPVSVRNGGDAPIRYALRSTTTEDLLAAQLELTIRVAVSTCTNDGFDASGTLLYGPDDLGATTGRNLVGDPSRGQQDGDRILAPGAQEVLCMRVYLPRSSDNRFQHLSTTATFEFVAESATVG